MKQNNSIKKSNRVAVLLALGLLCTSSGSVSASQLGAASKSQARSLASHRHFYVDSSLVHGGIPHIQLLQTNQMLLDGEDAAAQAAPDETAAAQVQSAETPAPADAAAQAEAPQADQQVQAQAQVEEQAQAGADAQAQAQAQAEAEAQAQAQAQAQAEAQAQAQAQAGADAQAQAQAQAEAEAQAQAQAQAEAEAQAQAAAAAPKPRGRANVQVAATADVNQAAAVAAAADALLPQDKPFNKMNAAEKKAYLAKKQKEKAEKAAKEARENPTVDENGEHIQTVAEAKEQARQLQEMLVAGEQAVEEKIAMEQQQLAAMPATPPPQEVDDGHEETVEEVKAKMAAAQAAMDQGLQETDNRVAQMEQESANMPNFGALADLHGSISNMSKMRKQKQLQDMASKLGVEIQPGEEQLDASDLTNTLIERAKAAGKTEEAIQAALAE